MLGVASSAGGLPALGHLLGGIPATFRLPILVAHHRGPSSAAIFVRLLKGRTNLEVKEARSGEWPRPGVVYVAPAERHLEVAPTGQLDVRRSGRVQYVCPSADLLFASMARVYGQGTMALVLTGYGRDGAEGAKEVRRRGGFVIAQDSQTSAYSGMPASAIETRRVDLVLPLHNLAYALNVLTGSL